VRLYHRGDRGEPIRDIQARLGLLGFPIDDEEGWFGASTEAAVRAFQETKGLPVDGIVGPETWRTLVDAGFRLGDRLLYRRVPMMRGDDVAELQRRLDALGFDTGNVDGIFGPNTLRALLDFQHNRGMPEDGIAGPAVIAELDLMRRATDKPGRKTVREHEWLQRLPRSIVGLRLYVDAGCRDEEESSNAWRAALGAVRYFGERGAYPILSRSVDTAPPERLRARRANRVDAAIVVSFVAEPTPGVYHFQSPLSVSAAGRAIAVAIADELGVPVGGRATPMLKETRSPAVVVAHPALDGVVGIRTARALERFHATAPESRRAAAGATQAKNRR